MRLLWRRKNLCFGMMSGRCRLRMNDFVGGMPSRVFVGHSIYERKAALTVESRAPEFFPLDSGAYKLSKEGYLLLQFAPSAEGMRVYDWTKKQVSSSVPLLIYWEKSIRPEDTIFPNQNANP